MSKINLRQNFKCSLEELKQDFAQACESRGLSAQAQAELLAHERLDKDTPVTLGLGLTNRCNLKCSMCYYHSPDASKTVSCSELSLSAIEQLLESIPHCQNVLLALEGEPLLHSDFLAVLVVALHYAPLVCLVTNGHALTADLCVCMHGILAEYNAGKASKHFSLSVSLEAVAPELYAQLRGGSFARLDRNLRAALEFFPALTLHVVVSNQNISHLPEIFAYAHEIGIKAISFDELNECDNAIAHGLKRVPQPELLEHFLTFLQQAKEFNLQLMFSQNFMSPHYMQEFKQRSQDLGLYPAIVETPALGCPFIRGFASVISGMRIFPCCGDFAPQSLSEISFDSVYNHDYLLYLRALWSLQQIPAICKSCLKID